MWTGSTRTIINIDKAIGQRNPFRIWFGRFAYFAVYLHRYQYLQLGWVVIIISNIRYLYRDNFRLRIVTNRTHRDHIMCGWWQTCKAGRFIESFQSKYEWMRGRGAFVYTICAARSLFCALPVDMGRFMNANLYLIHFHVPFIHPSFIITANWR